jgi:NADH:ubiquinone oxidoreductase subunit
MKEVFDVSYAVHRMGEERAQRKEIKKHHQINTNNTNARQSQLRALAASRDDDDENSSDSDTSSSLDSSDVDANDPLGVAVMKLKSRFENDPSGAELFRRDMQQKRQEKRTGKINRTDVKTVVAPGDVQRKPFELNLDNATLIERRRKSTPSGRELID